MSRIGGVLILLGFLSTTILASDCPIIFIHGHKSGAKPYDVDEQDSIIGGWTTWYPMHPDGSLKYHTVMTRIIDSHYKGYSAGEPLNCHMNTKLQSTGGEPRKIYNFSYYHPNGNPGIISLSDDSILVYISHGRELISGDFVITVFTQPPSWGYDFSAYWPRYVPVLSYGTVSDPTGHI